MTPDPLPHTDAAPGTALPPHSFLLDRRPVPGAASRPTRLDTAVAWASVIGSLLIVMACAFVAGATAAQHSGLNGPAQVALSLVAALATLTVTAGACLAGAARIAHRLRPSDQ